MPDRLLTILAWFYLLAYFSFCLAVGSKIIHSWFTKQKRIYLDSALCYPHVNPGEIRLLKLYPGRPGDPLTAWLYTTSFSDVSHVESYEALSYVWGKSSWRKFIMVNGVSLRITPNLHDALQHIRLVQDNRIIWVDAICIDQANDEEISRQVAIMGDIYKAAKQVINWLGPATSKTTLGMEALTFLFEDQDITVTPPWEKYPARRLRAAFNDILRRGYFERIWIVQENALASKITLQIGNYKLTWLRGVETHRAICRIKYAAISPSWAAAGLQDLDFRPLLEMLEQNMMMARMSVQKPCREMTVLDLAFDLRYRKATDQRDMLFALRNMLPEDLKASFVIDYSKSTDELYAEFFKEVRHAYEGEMKFVEQEVEKQRLESEAREKATYARYGW